MREVIREKEREIARREEELEEKQREQEEFERELRKEKVNCRWLLVVWRERWTAGNWVRR